MTDFQMAMLALTGGGFLLTCATVIVSVTRAVSKIEKDTSSKIADEVIARTNAIAESRRQTEKALADAVTSRNTDMTNIRDDMDAMFRASDDRVREIANALRGFTETVEKDVHRVEKFGLQYYVQKPEFERAIGQIGSDLKAGFAELKTEIREFKTEMKEDIKEARSEHRS
ncbi:hypothetical protein [Bradyrhizobium sp. CCBAU 51753]|uniref:hypothetical protein n=1 Tax=Bradyrhizobium sp. CCBAU 51753 TaxID=1325100 RepID=UPI00188CF6C5|nr:hypothetical protein [Bradyrhizobium sp. CCBAU 51753]QOZ25265.1 hypothetical protein XH93_17975 [Bradyrhizobium sp. CCBAU 51753]